MKRIYIPIAAILVIGAVACNKKLSVETPTTNISLDVSRLVGDTFIYKLGDTTKFLLTGSTGNLALYPGTAGFSYDNKDRTSSLGMPTLSFTTTANYGTQTNTLQLLATNKLAGLDSATVVNASWKDITSRASLATSATAVNSGTINLSDLISDANDSLFLAFKYNGVTGSTQHTWAVTNYMVNNVLPDRTYNLASLASDASYWKSYGNVYTPASAKWVPSTTALTIVGGGATSPSDTAWIVSKALYLGRVAPDASIEIKNVNDSDLTSYNYIYNAVGTYKAVWVSFNNTIKEQKAVLKTFYIKVQ